MLGSCGPPPKKQVFRFYRNQPHPLRGEGGGGRGGAQTVKRECLGGGSPPLGDLESGWEGEGGWPRRRRVRVGVVALWPERRAAFFHSNVTSLKRRATSTRRLRGGLQEAQRGTAKCQAHHHDNVSLKCMLYNAYCILFSVYCILHIVYCILRPSYCVLV